MTLQEAAELLDTISSLWPNYRPPDPLLAAKGWAAVLHDVSLDQAAMAVYALARRQREFAPTPGLILDTIRELTNHRLPTADEALAEVDREIRRVGYAAARPPMFANGRFQEPERPQFSCDAIRRAVDAVGYRDLCLATDDARQVVRSQFLKLYRETAERAALHAASDPLTGPDRQLDPPNRTDAVLGITHG